jgi:hypothetical protein
MAKTNCRVDLNPKLDLFGGQQVRRRVGGSTPNLCCSSNNEEWRTMFVLKMHPMEFFNLRVPERKHKEFMPCLGHLFQQTKGNKSTSTAPAAAWKLACGVTESLSCVPLCSSK